MNQKDDDYLSQSLSGDDFYNDKSNEEFNEIKKNIEQYRHLFPEQKRPTILITGKTGVGKTSSINTLFGKNVGKVGHFSRGTSEDEVYEWESNGENVAIVDLPGLGENKKNDKIFKEIYKKRIPQADGFMVVVAPPRPAEEGTLKTIRLLINCGVKSTQITFAFNKVRLLNYSNKNDDTVQVELDGLKGPTSVEHKEAIENAKKAFYADLKNYLPQYKFLESQIIEYDSLSGWNLHKVLTSVIHFLPTNGLIRLDKARKQAEKEIRERERKKLAEAKKKLEEKKDQIDDIERKKIEDTIKSTNEGLSKFEDDSRIFDQSIFGQVVNGLGDIVSDFDPEAGKAIKDFGNHVYKAVEKASIVVEKVIDKIFGWLW